MARGRDGVRQGEGRAEELCGGTCGTLLQTASSSVAALRAAVAGPQLGYNVGSFMACLMRAIGALLAVGSERQLFRRDGGRASSAAMTTSTARPGPRHWTASALCCDVSSRLTSSGTDSLRRPGYLCSASGAESRGVEEGRSRSVVLLCRPHLFLSFGFLSFPALLLELRLRSCPLMLSSLAFYSRGEAVAGRKISGDHWRSRAKRTRVSLGWTTEIAGKATMEKGGAAQRC